MGNFRSSFQINDADLTQYIELKSSSTVETINQCEKLKAVCLRKMTCEPGCTSKTSGAHMRPQLNSELNPGSAEHQTSKLSACER